MFAPTLINPGATGGEGFTTLTCGLKSMWVGIEGAPNTQFVAAEGTFYRKKIGWGVNVENDQFGLLSQKNYCLTLVGEQELEENHF